MKSPEEIRKGLAYCDSRDHMHNGCAGGCPYWCDKYGCHSTEMKIDALAYIQQLEGLASSRLRRMKLFRERANKYIKECVQLRRRVEKLEAHAPKWISVRERLPKPEQEVLLIAHGWKGQLLYIGRLRHLEAETSWLTGIKSMGSEWSIDGWSYLKEPLVTHWMPLPEPPKEG